MGQSLKQPDMLLTGVPRSGTTLVNSLFHSPPEQYMFYERNLNVNLYELDDFIKCGKWGAKQINVPAVHRFLANWKPRKIVCLVRSLQDCYLSYIVRAMDHYQHESKKIQMKEISMRIQMVSQMANLMCEAKEKGGLVTKEYRLPVDLWVRYEDFVTNPEEEMGRIEEVTGWGMGGSPTFYFDDKYNSLPREREVKLHSGKITSKAINRYSELKDGMLKKSTGLVNEQRYMSLFYPEK